MPGLPKLSLVGSLSTGVQAQPNRNYPKTRQNRQRFTNLASWSLQQRMHIRRKRYTSAKETGVSTAKNLRANAIGFATTVRRNFRPARDMKPPELHQMATRFETPCPASKAT